MTRTTAHASDITLVDKPLVDYTDSKANIEALIGLVGGESAYASDTGKLGYYDASGSVWVWTGGSGIPDAPADDEVYGRKNNAWEALTLFVDGLISAAIIALGLGDLAYLDTWTHTHEDAPNGGTVSYNDLTDKPTITNPPATTAENDFQVGGVGGTLGTWVKKTLAETITILRTSLDSIYAKLTTFVENYYPHRWLPDLVWEYATVAVVSTTKLKITLTANSNLGYYWKGSKVDLGATTLEVTSTDDKAEGIWYCYTRDGVTFELNQTAFYIWDIVSGARRADLMAWEFYWDNSNNTTLWIQPEFHAMMNPAVHGYAHESFGTRYANGLDVSYGTTASNNDTRVKITSGEIHDEDISAYITHAASPDDIWEQILGSAGTADANYAALPIYYLSGATPVWRKETANSYPFRPVSNNYIYYNRLNAGSYDYSTSITQNNYVVYWIVGTTNQQEPIVVIPGRQDNANLTAAQSETFPSLLTLFTEYKLLYRIIYRGLAANTNNGKCQIISVTDYRRDNIANNAAAVATVTAALVSFTPAGNLAATNVQAAIEELDTEKLVNNVSTTDRILGRDTTGAGAVEELTLSAVLDFVGSAAQGDILYRGASTWTRLGAGTSGQFLQTLGAAANPAWASHRDFLPFGVYLNINPISVSSSAPYAASVDRALTVNQWGQAWYVAAGTNNGSNYWKVQILRITDFSEIANFTTAAYSADTWYVQTVTSFSISSLSASDKGVFLFCTKTGSPPNLYLFGPQLEVTVL